MAANENTEQLDDEGTDLNDTDNMYHPGLNPGFTALHTVVNAGKGEVQVRNTITKDNFLRQTPGGRQSALHFAVQRMQRAPINALLGIGHGDVYPSVKVDRRILLELCNSSGQTAMHLACENGYTYAVQMLKDNGCSLTTLCNKQLTPRQTVMKTRRWDALWILDYEVICMAFAMGLHPRLGEGSKIPELDPGVLRMILEAGFRYF